MSQDRSTKIIDAIDCTKCPYGECDPQKGPCRTCVMSALKDQIEDSVIILQRIDKRTAEHSVMLENLSEAKESWKEMAGHTKSMAETMKDYGTTNKELIGLVAGKKQVPLSIYILTTLFISTAFFIILAYISKIDLVIGKDGIKVIRQIQAENIKVEEEK